MEIEVGEYVRTKENGIIGKIEQIGVSLFWLEDESAFKIQEKSYKHSKNIIDLIEVGDYVNGYKVIGVTLDPAPSGKCVDIDCDKPSYESYLFEEQIYSIVTKEQFASIEYKVEEDK